MWIIVCKFLLLVTICITSGFSSPLSSETSAPLSSETSERTTDYEDVVSTHSLLALTSMQAFLKNYCLNELDSCSSNPDDNNFENNTKTDLQLNLLNYVLINNMSAVLNQMVSEEKEKSLPERCIEAIRSHDMEEAVKILSSFKKINRINLVINRVYEHNILNFEKAFNFCVSINDSEKSKIAFDALYYETKSSGHLSIDYIEKMKNQMKCFKVSSSSMTKTIAVDFVRQIYNQVLANKIESLYKLRDETDTVLDYIKSLKFKGMKIFAFKILLQKMKEDKFSRGSILQVAYQLNKTLQEELNADITESKDVSEAEETILDIIESKGQSEKLMNLLPECIKNVVSSEDVYIKNSLYNEYIYASDVKLDRDTRFRHVFTWVPLNASCHNFDKVWSVEFVENGKQITLTNKKYWEILEASNRWKFDNSKEKKWSMATYSLEHFTVDGAEYFNLKPVGDECIMISAFNKTVYVSEEGYDGENRFVFGNSSPVDTNDNSTHMMFEVA